MVSFRIIFVIWISAPLDTILSACFKCTSISCFWVRTLYFILTTNTIPYLIIFPHVHSPPCAVCELPVDSAPSWSDKLRADLPLACSQHQPRIYSIFFPYNKKCGPDYIRGPLQQYLPKERQPDRLLIYADEFTLKAGIEKQLYISSGRQQNKNWMAHTGLL